MLEDRAVLLSLFSSAAGVEEILMNSAVFIRISKFEHSNSNEYGCIH